MGEYMGGGKGVQRTGRVSPGGCSGDIPRKEETSGERSEKSVAFNGLKVGGPSFEKGGKGKKDED